MTTRSQRSPIRGARRLAGVLASAAGALLVVFHLLLFADRIAAATIVAPEAVLRWLGAAGLLALALLFRRNRLPMASGRSGFAFWALVLLLHVGAGSAPVDPHHAPLVLLGSGLAAGAALLRGTRTPGRRPRRSVGAIRTLGVLTEPPPRHRLPDLALGFIPRPPPVL